LWCGGGHLQKEWPEKGKVHTTPSCCNCKLLEGTEPHPSNCLCSSRAREELLRKKVQKAPAMTPPGGVFSSRFTTTDISFAAAAATGPVKHDRQGEGTGNRGATNCI